MWAMDEREWLAERFEAHRRRLRAVAYRMLGSVSEADDAVQEAWIRLSRADTSGVENLAGWLTTVVARVCLDMLRSRKSRREEALTLQHESGSDPEHEVLLADSVGLALLVVLETLTPAERVAFVLHDMFDLSFDEIAPIVGRSPTAARQLASRARPRVQGAESAPAAHHARPRKIVDAFLAASTSRSSDLSPATPIIQPTLYPSRPAPRRCIISSTPRTLWPNNRPKASSPSFSPTSSAPLPLRPARATPPLRRSSAAISNSS